MLKVSTRWNNALGSLPILFTFFLILFIPGGTADAQGGYVAPYIKAYRVSKYEIKVEIGGHYDTLYSLKEYKNGVYTRDLCNCRLGTTVSVASEGVYKYVMDYLTVDQVKTKKSAQVEVIFPPEGPETVNVSSTKVQVGDTVTVTWPDVSGADYYGVYQRTNTGDWEFLSQVDDTSPKSHPVRMENIGSVVFKVTACKESDYTEGGDCGSGKESDGVKVEGIRFDIDSQGYSVFAGDLNGDGVTDYYFYSRERVLILHGDIATPIMLPANPTFAIYSSKTDLYSPWSHNAPVAKSLTDFDVLGLSRLKEGVDYYIGDFDGDGKLDFLFRGQSAFTELPFIVYGVNQFALPSSTYNFLQGSELAQLVSNRSKSFYIADTNKDGRSDFVLKSGNSFIADTAYLSQNGVPTTKTELTVPETKYANLAGKTEAKASVTAAGAASYIIPISVPQGSGGHTPQLALNYTSQGVNGLMGQGWNISGLSAIRYCHRTLVHDNSKSVKKDRFCLDGQRLMVVQGSYGAVGSVYKTEIDSFRTVTAVDGAAGAPDHFRVESKDGKVAKYRFSGQNFYPLSEIRDSSGNNLIRYSYSYDGNGFRIDHIDYAFGVGSSANASVKFVYESRPGSIPQALLIGSQDLKRRIARLEITNNGSEYRTYHIQYLKKPASSLNSAVSRVSSIQECVKFACLSPITFDWNIIDQPGFSAAYYAETQFESDASEFRRGRVADLDGDGRADYVYFHKDSGDKLYFRTAISNGQTWIKNSFSLRARSEAYGGWHLADYNGDGGLDLIHGTDSGWQVHLFDGVGFAGGTISLNIPVANSAQVLLQDVTGDGLPDLIARSQDKSEFEIFYAIKKAGGGFGYGSSPDHRVRDWGYVGGLSNEIGDLRAFRLQDENGDGRTEILVPVRMGCDGDGCHFGMEWRVLDPGRSYITSGFVLGMGVTDHNLHSDKFDYIPGDLNRDGKSDLVFKDHEDNWSYFIRGVGSESNRISLPEITGNKARLADYNHDGYLDLIWPANGVLNVKLWNGNGFNNATATNIPASDSDRYSVEFADINGDGLQEYIHIRDTDHTHWVHYHSPLASAKANNVITKVINAYGEESSFTYKALTDASSGVFYTKGQSAGSLNWGQPVFDITGSLYVVSKHQFSMPVAANANNKEAVTYSYKGLRVQGGGRGSLGFEQITEIDNRAGKKVTTFAQQFPYTGMVTKVEQRSPQGNLLFTLSNTLNKRADSAAPYWPYVDISTEQHYLLKSNGAVAGPLYKTVVTDSDYDDYGNLELSTTTTKNAAGQGVSTVVQDNNFVGTTCNRNRGRICSTKITTTRDGVSKSREVSFAYYPVGDGKAGLLKTEKIEPNYSGEDKDQVQLTTSYTYDDYGNRLTTTKTAANEPNRIATSGYDPQKRYIDVTRDADNRLLAEVVARNTLGQPTEVRTYLNVSGSSYVTTDIVYDVLGRETFRDENSSPWVKTEYKNCTGCGVTGAKTYTVVTSETGAKITSYFDALGRKIHERKLGFDSSDSIETSFEYDDLGRLERQSEPYQTGGTPLYWTKNHYDIQSRITSIQHPDGYSTTHAEPVPEGNYIVSTSTNPNGQNRKEKKNALGELVFVEDHHGGKLEYRYDPLGNVTDTISHGRAGENLGITISVGYDQRGRKTAMSDPDKGNWTYKYNGFGDLIEQVDSKGQKVVTQYDKYGRPERRTDYLISGAVETVENHTRWYYDDKDAGGASIPYALGKVTSVIMSQNTGEEICYAATTQYCAIYEYNSVGAQTGAITILGADGVDGEFYSQTAYDNLGRPYLQYDVLNGVVKNGGSSIVSGIREYYTNTGYLRYVRDLNTNKELYRVIDTNSRGQVSDFDINSGTVRVDHGYDAATGRLMSQKADRSIGGTVQQLAYTWDKIGNFTSRHNQRRGKQESFCYDNLNRLLQVNANTLSTDGCNPTATGTQYQYDSIGNIEKKDGVDYVYGSSKPHAATSVGGVSYAYNDNNGNLTSDGTGRSFTYTSFDKPKLIQNTASNDSTAFSYGPDRSRYKRVDTRSNGEVVTTLYLGSVERIHKQSTNTYEWKRYLRGGAVYTYKTDAAFNQQSLIQRYLLKDHIGSTDVVLDGNGAPIQAAEMSFNPWGQRRDTNWQELDIADLIGNDYSVLKTYNDITTHGFTGHEMVDALGIIHMNGRIYDPNLGRFLQADPFIDGVDDTQGYNRYSYVKGNPLTLTDPTGYYSLDDFFDDANEFLDKHIGSHGGSFEIGINYGAPNGNDEMGGASFWAQPGAAGAPTPEGSVPGAFGENEKEEESFLDRISIQGTPLNGGGFDSAISEESDGHLTSGQSNEGATEGGFQNANFSIGIGEVADLSKLADELNDDFIRDAKHLTQWIRKNEDHKDNAPLISALISIGYLDRGSIDSYRYLLEKNPSNGLELGAMTQDAMRGLRSSWATSQLKTIAKQYGDLQWKYFTGGGKFDPGKQLKRQVRGIVYDRANTPEARKQIYEAVYDVVETGVTKL